MQSLFFSFIDYKENMFTPISFLH